MPAEAHRPKIPVSPPFSRMAKHSKAPPASAASEPVVLGDLIGGPRSGAFLLLAGLGLAIIAGFYTFLKLYGLGGNQSNVQWWWSACNTETDYVHGRFVPIAIVGLIFLARKQLAAAALKPNNWGIALVLVGCLFFFLSVRTLQPRVAIGALPFLILGASLFLCGWEVTKLLAFPVALIYFAIPLPGLNQATNQLQILATQTAFQLSSLLGANIEVAGNNINSADGSWPGFNIAEGCSGVRSLIALTLIAAIYAHLTQKALWKKVVLFAASVPLALIANGLRVTTIILIAEYWSADFAAKTYHNFSGFIFFPLGLAGLILLDLILNRRLPFVPQKDERRSQVRRTVTGAGGGQPGEGTSTP